MFLFAGVDCLGRLSCCGILMIGVESELGMLPASVYTSVQEVISLADSFLGSI